MPEVIPSRCATASRPRDWTSGSRATRAWQQPPLEGGSAKPERREATVERSNVGGYHSHTDLFDARSPARDACCATSDGNRAREPWGADVSAQAPATTRRGRRCALSGGRRRRLPAGGARGRGRPRAGRRYRRARAAPASSRAHASSWTRRLPSSARVNVSRAGHFNSGSVDDHAGASASGVLWVRAPPAPRGVEFSGCLFLALRFPREDAPGRVRARRARRRRAHRVPRAPRARGAAARARGSCAAWTAMRISLAFNARGPVVSCA